MSEVIETASNVYFGMAIGMAFGLWLRFRHDDQFTWRKTLGLSVIWPVTLLCMIER